MLEAKSFYVKMIKTSRFAKLPNHRLMQARFVTAYQNSHVIFSLLELKCLPLVLKSFVQQHLKVKGSLDACVNLILVQTLFLS